MVAKYSVYRDDDDLVLGVNQPVESDYPVWLFIELIDMWAATGDESGERYCCCIQSASAGFAGNECDRARESCGISLEDWAQYSDQTKAEILRENGLAANLWQQSGNNRRDLLRAAKRELLGINCLFGFYVDRQQNAIGSTGWDFMRGDLHRPLRELA